MGRWKVTKTHLWKDQVARLSHEGTQLRVTGTDRLSCETVQVLSQTAWVQIPVLWLTSHALISSLPSVSISPEQRLQKYCLPLWGILWGLNELIHVKHLEQCLTHSKCLINGGCLCSVLPAPCVTVAVVQYDHSLMDFSLLPGTWPQAEPQQDPARHTPPQVLNLKGPCLRDRRSKPAVGKRETSGQIVYKWRLCKCSC